MKTNSGSTHFVVLSEQEAEEIWKLDDPHALFFTSSQFSSDAGAVSLRNDGDPTFRFGLFGAEPVDEAGRSDGKHGIFSVFRDTVPPATIDVVVTPIRPASERPAWKNGPAAAWRKPVTLAPEAADFTAAAEWSVALHGNERAQNVTDWLLRIRYAGDVAHLKQRGRLIDDDFWNGLPWTIGMREVAADPNLPLTLSILPLPRPFPLFLQNANELPRTNGPFAVLQQVEAVPQYGLEVKLKSLP